ncbi:MAG: hypothetical protein ACXWHB_13790 [Usitatibacter sp.]
MKFAAALVACLFTSLASATTVTTDFSDMWWVPSESGWGANMIQQGDTIFVTLFVYAQNGTPTWYVAPATSYQGVVANAQVFSGLLYQTTGPYYGAASFNPNSVTATQVGTLSFSGQTNSTGTLSYSVNGLNVNKSVQRQTWRTDNLAGRYRGATIGTYTGCPGTSTVDVPNTLTITQTASNMIVNEFGPNYTCQYTGILTQTGRIGNIDGTGVCAVDGAIQNFHMTNVQVGTDFVSMAMTTDTSTCHFSGRIGGMREP